VEAATVEITAAGSAVPAAKVQLGEGEFQIKDIPDGVYVVTFRADGFYPLQVSNVRVRFLHPVVLDVVLNFEAIDGFAIETDGMAHVIGQLPEGEAGGGARVCFASSKSQRCAVASAAGKFYLFLVPDVYQVSVERGDKVRAIGVREYSRAGWHREDLTAQ